MIATTNTRAKSNAEGRPPNVPLFRRLGLLAVVFFACADMQTAGALPPQVAAAEQQRIATVARISEPTLAIFDSAGQGGGSGVLISPDGYALTNFHVTAPCGPAMKCGMNNGELYDAVIVGIDPPGDVALIKLLGRDDFPTAELGDSDTARVGDQVFVVGNPFLLAEDYHPTVTYGILSGTHRYQYPSGTLLEYADCLQTDASINPGNSGGPLFNSQGQLIGINGRGSFEKRGRVNVGVGYAISIDQIKHFLSHLKAGRVVDHATLGATVTSTGGGNVVVDDLLERSDAFRRGLRYGDRVLSFAGRDISTANAMKNALGIYPAGWKTTISFRDEDETTQTTVRLASLHGPGELESLIQKQAAEPVPIQPPGPEGEPGNEEPPTPKLPELGKVAAKPKLPEAVKSNYIERTGFANYWFNRQHQNRLQQSCRQVHAIETKLPLSLQATDDRGQSVSIAVSDELGEYRSNQGEFRARFSGALQGIEGPPGSGGLLAAMDSFRRFACEGITAFDQVVYLGQLPVGRDLQLRDCLVTTHHGLNTRFYFDVDSQQLVYMELFTADDLDPCEIAFSEFRPWKSGELPFLWQIKYGDEIYATLSVDKYSQTQLADSDDSEGEDE